MTSRPENGACPRCAERGIFGYRDQATGDLTWYCAKHRVGQYWADARSGDAVIATSPAWEGWNGR